jgi:hypothetical protein
MDEGERLVGARNCVSLDRCYMQPMIAAIFSVNLERLHSGILAYYWLYNQFMTSVLKLSVSQGSNEHSS